MNFKKNVCKLEYILMAYNLVFVLYMLAAIPVEVIVTGKYSLLVFLGSVFVTGLSIYACVRAKVTFSWLHGMALAFFAWVLVSVGYHFNETATGNIPHMLLLFCLVVPSFLSFLSFSKKQCTTQWKVIAVGYNLAVTILSVIGIWCTLFDIDITFAAIGYKYIGFRSLKLYIFCHYNTVGHFVTFAILLAVFMMVCTTKKWVRFLFALDFLVLFITLGLTYCRTAELTVSACVGISICYFIWHTKRLQGITPFLKNIALRLVLCGAVFVAIVAIGYSSLVLINTKGNSIASIFAVQNDTQEQLEKELALLTEEERAALTDQDLADLQQEVAQNTQNALDDKNNDLTDARSLNDLSTIGTRVLYWSAAWNYFAQNPTCQLFGASPAGVAPILLEIIPDYCPPHTHNVFVQVPMATGVPGLVLFVVFWGTALFFGVRLFFCPRHQFADGCFPLLLILCFTALGLQENMMFSLETSLMLPGFIMGCAHIASLRQPHNQESN